MARDNFSKATIEVLQKRVGGKCSNPVCRIATSGPHTNPEKSLNVGVAAHISAASAGGPRYDPTMASSKRKSAANGIWLCAKCATEIDKDPDRYPTKLLKRWKKRSEREAYLNLARLRTRVMAFAKWRLAAVSTLLVGFVAILIWVFLRPGLTEMSSVEFDDILKNQRDLQRGAMASLFQPHEQGTAKRAWQEKFAVAVFTDGDDHTKAESIFDVVMSLLLQQEVSGTIEDFRSVLGPPVNAGRRSSALTWIRSLENSEIELEFDGKIVRKSVRGFAIYAGIRQALKRLLPMLEDVRISNSEQLVEFVNGSSNEAAVFRGEAKYQVESKFDAGGIRVDKKLSAIYLNWLEDPASYDHASTLEGFKKSVVGEINKAQAE